MVHVRGLIRIRGNISNESNKNFFSFNTRKNDKEELIILQEDVKINHMTVYEKMDGRYWKT